MQRSKVTQSKNILISLLLAGGLTFGAATAGMAEPHRRDGGGKQCPGQFHHHKKMTGMHGARGGFEHQPRFLRGIELTEEQRDKVFEITYAKIPVDRTFHKEIRKLHQQIRELPLSADYDAGKMRKLVDAEARLQADHLLKQAEADNRIYKLLTDDQRKQLAERKQKGDRQKGEHKQPG